MEPHVSEPMAKGTSPALTADPDPLELEISFPNDADGVVQPGPAPRFSRTPGAVQGPPAAPGQHTDEALSAWGLSDDRIADLRKSGAVA